MSVAYFRRLFEYNSWANGLLLDRAAEVPEAGYFAERPGLSFGSLHATLVHLVMAEATWLGRWRDGPDAPGLGNAREAVSVARNQLTTLESAYETWQANDTLLHALVGGLSEEDLDRAITYRIAGGAEYTDVLALQLGHLVNHGTQFRAEAAVRLTELGHSPGDLDFTVVLRGLHRK